jgi:hypothetical protein
MFTLMETKLVQGTIQLLVPRPWSLTKTIQSSPESQHLVLFSGDDKSLRLLHVDFFREFSIEKHSLHVHVMDLLSFICSQRQDEAH